jgi:hypothetical protein
VSPSLRKLFREVRRSPIGHCVSPSVPYARDCAVTLTKWRALESIGAVRLRAEADTDWEPGCDCGDPDCASNNPESEAFGSIGEFRTDFDNPDWYPGDTDDESLPWVSADSVWGHVGYRDVLDWRDNPYIIDVMAETIAAFCAAWKAHVRQGV